MARELIKRRYRIEASTPTLVRFMLVLKPHGVSAFVQSVKCDVNEEYYYVVVMGSELLHVQLRDNRFTDSIPRPL